MPWIILLTSCTTAPVNYPDLKAGYAEPPRDDGGFSTLVNTIRQNFGAEESGYLLIDSNQDALRWRLTTIDSAKHTLDLQYYLWYPDDGARLIASRLLDAANRGVRVRIILDDLMVIDNDKAVAAFDDHPNIEVRLFNPWVERENLVGRGMEALERMERLNFRMHNKLLVADNQAVIMGGRNIGNHYFGLSSDYNFHDLDVLGIGPVAPLGSEIFDHFWNSKWVHIPFAMGEQPGKQEISQAIIQLHDQPKTSDRLNRFPLDTQNWNNELTTLQEKLVAGTSTVIFDKIASEEKISQTMAEPIRKLFSDAQHEILVVNPYLIPSSINQLKEIIDRGGQGANSHQFP